MESKLPGFLSIAAAIYLIAIWWVFLFTAQPDCLSSFQAAKDALLFALSPQESGAWFFIFTLVSILVCSSCGALFFLSKNKSVPMIVTALHSATAAFIYNWSLVGFIALPLLFLKKWGKNA